MTLKEWHDGTDLSRMLGLLSGNVSDSKLRLFACACCRQIWELIDTKLHRRIIEFAESFARGAGRELYWSGSGNWASRTLSCPVSEIKKGDEWKALDADLAAEKDKLTETESILRYDYWTPQETAASTLHFRFDYPYYVARGAAALRTAPFNYWRPPKIPSLTDLQDDEWVRRIDGEMASQCDLLRSIYGQPDVA